MFLRPEVGTVNRNTIHSQGVVKGSTADSSRKKRSVGIQATHSGSIYKY